MNCRFWTTSFKLLLPFVASALTIDANIDIRTEINEAKVTSTVCKVKLNAVPDDNKWLIKNITGRWNGQTITLDQPFCFKAGQVSTGVADEVLNYLLPFATEKISPPKVEGIHRLDKALIKNLLNPYGFAVEKMQINGEWAVTATRAVLSINGNGENQQIKYRMVLTGVKRNLEFDFKIRSGIQNSLPFADNTIVENIGTGTIKINKMNSRAHNARANSEGRLSMFDIAIKPKNPDGEIVVLIHGLFHCGAVMYPLGRFLNNHGYVVFCYDYRSTRGDVAKHAARFKNYLENLACRYPDKRINIVTHSLGSLVTRQALAHFAKGKTEAGEILTRQTIGRVVFTAPPNRGSKVATLALKWLPFVSRLLRPLPDLSYGESSSVHDIPIPTDIELGIIAAKYDHMVPRDSVQLPDVQTDYKIMPAIHVIIMNTPSVKREILHFLQHGKFKKNHR